MENSTIIQILLLILLLPLLQAPVAAKYKHYIVYLGIRHDNKAHRLQDFLESVTRSHNAMISSVSKRYNNDHDPSKRLIYSYTKIFNGFAATLLEGEANDLAKHPEVISIFKSKKVTSYTTHSWDFLSSFQQQARIPASEKLSKKAKHGEDMIIANVDSGVWPESESFNDIGFGPIPIKFKGQCDNANDPTTKCNRKLIGAKYFNKGLVDDARLNNVTLSLKPTFRDMEGHGTHTLSTAGGNVVTQVQERAKVLRLLGLNNVTARGGAPRARVATYKVLWPEVGSELSETVGEGSSIDCLAGLEAAIGDGVDVINLSVGPPGPIIGGNSGSGAYYLEDSFAVSSFHAMINGILAVVAAGNSGPNPSTVENFSPWVLTVGASTFGRAFTCDISLGNRQKIKGARFVDNTTSMSETTSYPLITGTDARIDGVNPTKASYCTPRSLDPEKVKGKILVCLKEAIFNKPEALHKSKVAMQAGAVGLILANDQTAGLKLLPDDMDFVVTAHITYNDAQTLLSYINSTRNPTASISSTMVEIGVTPAPLVPDFSSRGPNPITPGILKPDVIAPGVSVIAAYSVAENALPLPQEYEPSTGTSMAAPHATAIVALLKKLHPDWSTAAIMSSIITTASPRDNKGMPILEDDMVHEATPFAIGAGLIQPDIAMDPGLVYDMNKFDYLNFLCAQQYNSTAIIEKFTRQYNYKCPTSFSLTDFNYPSITVADFSGTVTVTRRLKNVGQPGTYTARLEQPQGISIAVEPKTLAFSRLQQEIGFKLVFSTTTANRTPPNDYTFGSLEWSDGKHVVRSPIVVIKAKDVTTKASN